MGKGKKWLIGCLGTLGICGIGTYAAVWRSVDFLGASRDLDKEVARAKVLGNPLTAAELVPPMPADKDNAAVELGPVLRDFMTAELNPIGSKVTDALAKNDFARAQALIAPHQGVLAIARKATRKSKFALERDWDLGVDLRFPEYAQSKGLAKLLAAQARLDFRKGNIAVGIENIQAGYRIGEFTGQECTLIGMLVAISSRGIVSRSVEAIAVENRTRESVLSRLESAVANRPIPNLKTALRSEMFIGTTTIRNLDKFGGFTNFRRAMSGENEDETEQQLPPLDPKRIRREGLPPGLLERAFLARHLAVWNDALEQMQKTPEPRELAKWLDDRADTLVQKKTLSYALFLIMFPVWGQAGEELVKCEATEGATRGFLKVLRYQAKTGRYPKDLAEAGFQEIDPFSKAPYRFYLKGDVVRVYSVGPNGKDEEGLGREALADKTVRDRLDDVSVRTDRPVKLPPATVETDAKAVPSFAVPKVK